MKFDSEVNSSCSLGRGQIGAILMAIFKSEAAGCRSVVETRSMCLFSSGSMFCALVTLKFWVSEAPFDIFLDPPLLPCVSQGLSSSLVHTQEVRLAAPKSS